MTESEWEYCIEVVERFIDQRQQPSHCCHEKRERGKVSFVSSSVEYRSWSVAHLFRVRLSISVSRQKRLYQSRGTATRDGDERETDKFVTFRYPISTWSPHLVPLSLSVVKLSTSRQGERKVRGGLRWRG